MLTMQLPTLLALLGTALMAIVIFAPERVVAPTVSFAPPVAPPPFERRHHPSESSGLPYERSGTPNERSGTPYEHWDPPSEHRFEPFGPVTADAAPLPCWPTLIDPRAAGCDVEARLALIDALGSVRTPWARAIVQRAVDDEPDASVRAAALAALES